MRIGDDTSYVAKSGIMVPAKREGITVPGSREAHAIMRQMPTSRTL